jgi:GT2 family glycosyltransferase
MVRQSQCIYPIAVRTVALDKPLSALSDVSGYRGVRLYVTLGGRLLGGMDIANHDQTVSVARLREAIAEGIAGKLLEDEKKPGRPVLPELLSSTLERHFLAGRDGAGTLPVDIPVSVVVATLDRPQDLRTCLSHLTAQVSPRPVEIIVVDNNPASGLTPPVVAEFPTVVLVSEPRRGLAYARNTGFIAARGDIVIATDDDVRMPPDWLEKLAAPFARSDVAAVTGNVLPLELDTPSQCLFEVYGGLGRGFDAREADMRWFRSFRWHAAPTWRLGATANAAFRTSVFDHPDIGLMDEALGPGMPSGVGEDTYLFYRIIKAGYSLVYQPDAYVWHRHRRDMSGLRHQIYNYSKGHVAYQLTTLLRDRDLRALTRLLYALPRSQLKRSLLRLRRRSAYPLSLILLETLGTLAGPWALWRSRRRVRREGRSGPYVSGCSAASTGLLNKRVREAG